MLKILVSGTREGVDFIVVKTMINHVIQNYKYDNYVLLHGDAKGVDTQAATYCKSLNWEIRAFPSDWHKYGKSAGILRNQDMVNEQPDYGVFIPSVNSIGTYDCLQRFKQLHKPGIVYDPTKGTYYEL
jgi:SLOG family YspA-like protein